MLEGRSWSTPHVACAADGRQDMEASSLPRVGAGVGGTGRRRFPVIGI